VLEPCHFSFFKWWWGKDFGYVSNGNNIWIFNRIELLRDCKPLMYQRLFFIKYYASNNKFLKHARTMMVRKGKWYLVDVKWR